jgi:HECT-domain (ubiquitin-transferase)
MCECVCCVTPVHRREVITAVRQHVWGELTRCGVCVYVLFRSAVLCACSPFHGCLSWLHSFFRFAGRICGLALYHNHLMNVFFTVPFLKQILGSPVGYMDIQSVDPAFWKNLDWIVHNNVDQADLGLTFEVLKAGFGKSTCIELRPNGAQIDVTEENKVCERVCESMHVCVSESVNVSVSVSVSVSMYACECECVCVYACIRTCVGVMVTDVCVAL